MSVDVTRRRLEKCDVSMAGAGGRVTHPDLEFATDRVFAAFRKRSESWNLSAVKPRHEQCQNERQHDNDQRRRYDHSHRKPAFQEHVRKTPCRRPG